jgi:Protein of unknown function (DUF3611)
VSSGVRRGDPPSSASAVLNELHRSSILDQGPTRLGPLRAESFAGHGAVATVTTFDGLGEVQGALNATDLLVMNSIDENGEASSQTLNAGHSDALARAFSRFGWIGFWAQVTIGAIPVVLMIYAFMFGRNTTAGTRGGLLLIEYLAAFDVMVLAFTTLWSYRYTRLAKQIADPQRRPSLSILRRAAWTGAAASAFGILLSILVMLTEVAQLFFYFLRAPQAGIPVIQTTGGGPTSWVSAADIMSLLALNFSLLVELLVLGLSLWLLSRSTIASQNVIRSTVPNGVAVPLGETPTPSPYEVDVIGYNSQPAQGSRSL